MTQTGSLERKAMALLSEALEQPSPERVAWVKARSGGDEALAARVLALLDADLSTALRTGGAGQDAGEEPMPERAGAYQITGLIGRGGMGAVYEGTRDSGDFDHRVAIKIIRPGVLSESLVARFERERQILADLDHPNIARLLDGGEMPDGSPFMVMEYVDGQPIVDWAEAGNLSVDDRVWLFNDVCAAVRHAHQNLIVHRDITPSNVLVTKTGAVKLIDFGIAKPQTNDEIWQDDSDASGKSLASLSFTPGFAAPERAKGAPANTLSDIYSLGKLLETLVITHQPGADIEAIIARASHYEPANRYASVDALIDDLTNLRTGYPVEAHKGGTGYRFGKYFQRRKLAVLLGSAAVLGLVGALGVTLFQYNRAETALTQANARFEQARGLSRNLIFDVYDSFDNVAGTLEPRKSLAELIRAYVDDLAQDPNAPDDVLYDIGVLKLRLSDLYGGIGMAHFGETDMSFDLLKESETALETLLQRDPENSDALAELAMTKRLLTMQHLQYKLDTTAAAVANQQVLDLTLKGAAFGDDNERTFLRHFWSARTDKLQIMLADEAHEAALLNARNWRAEMDQALFDKLGGGERIAAYLAHQESEMLISLDRPEEAIAPLLYAETYRTDRLAETPDGYYEMTQLMTVYADLSSAYRGNDEAAASVAYAQKAVQLARKIAASDPSDAGGPEGIAIMLQRLAQAQALAGRSDAAFAAVNEAITLARAQADASPDNAFYLQNLFFALSTKAQISQGLGQSTTACEAAAQAQLVMQALTETGDVTAVLSGEAKRDLQAVIEAEVCPV